MTGKWAAQLPALLGQPGAAGAGLLAGGDARGDFSASLGAKRELQVRLALTNLVSATAAPLPGLTADLRADLEADGTITFKAPLLFEREGRTSDLTLAGTVVPGAGGLAINAKLTGELVVLDDVQLFALPWFALPAAPAPPAAAGASARPSAPFWNGVTGQCTLALKKAAYRDQLQVTDVGGVLRVEPQAFKLVNGRAGFGPDSTLRLNGGTTFDPALPQPYGLAAEFSLENFDPAPVFRALDPARSPTVEGRFSFLGRLAGAGTTLADLAEHTHGDLQVSSKGGLCRALSADVSDRIQKTQSTVATIGSFLGVLTDDYVNKTKIISEIARALAEIPFDQLSLTASRDASLNLLLKDLTLISPELRLGGSGVVHHSPGVPVLAQPMEMQLNLGARGRMADLMKRAGLLDAQQDNLGYAAFAVPLKLGGTLAKPDTGQIRDALLNSALVRSGLLDSILGRGK